MAIIRWRERSWKWNCSWCRSIRPQPPGRRVDPYISPKPVFVLGFKWCIPLGILGCSMNGNRLKRSQEAILAAMGHLLLDAEERGGPIERRSEIRSPVRVPVELRLLPSGADDVLDIPNRPGITAHTSNLSPSGLGLLHSEPLE